MPLPSSRFAATSSSSEEFGEKRASGAATAPTSTGSDKSDKKDNNAVGGSVLSRVKMFEQVNQEIRKTSTTTATHVSPSTSEKSMKEDIASNMIMLKKDSPKMPKSNNKKQMMDTVGDQLVPIDGFNSIPNPSSSNITMSINKDSIDNKYFSQRKTQIINNANHQSARISNVSNRDTPDPLDREAVKHIPLKDSVTSSSMEKFKHSEVRLNAPERIRKFKLAEESMRRVRDRGFSESSQSHSAITNSGVRSLQGEDSKKLSMNMEHIPIQYSGRDGMNSSTRYYEKFSSRSSDIYMRESDQMNLNITSPSSLSGRRGLPSFSIPMQPSSKMSPNRNADANDYFSMVGSNYYSKDDDDETQFNSVYIPDQTSNDRLKKGQSNDIHLNLSPVHRSSENSNLDFENRIDGQSKNISFRSQQQDRKYQEISASDDDESFTDNRSWTGRMRAQKAAQKAMSIDRRMMMNNNNESRVTVVTSLKKGGRFDDNDDNISVTSRVIKSVNKEKKLAYADAKEGIDEVRKIAKNDPTTAAVGAGVVTGLMGSIALGPVGLLLGAGVAGIGYKVAQLPENERTEVGNKASTVAQKIHRTAVKANDYLSSKCAQACGEGQNSSRIPMQDEDLYDRRSDIPIVVTSESLRRPNSPQVKDTVFASMTNLPPTSIDISSTKASDQAPMNQPIINRSTWRIAPACKRMTRITPVGQIHSLDPALHPRAWLDVMASAWTSFDEKNEAMEEILLLSKDKNHARMLLEEGILDAFMHILRSFFRTYIELQSRTGYHTIALETYTTDPNFHHAKLAATCCVALGKAHCAVLSVDGEERIAAHVSIPVNRQVAQMLYEIPHHKVIQADNDSDNERFVLSTDMTMEQAIELAGSVVSLSIGKIEISDLMLL